jgi:2-methylcitrate dehydratase PrpD
MELTRRLVEHIVHLNYEALPVEVVEKTKRHILDMLGVMLPPTVLERGCIALSEIVREMGGKQESTLIGSGEKVPCAMAAFANGSLCHSLDYDDTLDEFPNHPSSHTFPAALAVAERQGDVSGKEFITAVALGMDLNVRLSASPRGSLLEDYAWNPITVFGVFSATAVAGKLFSLNQEQMTNALGIALERSAGIGESMASVDSELRAIRDAFGNREGVLAALMAQKGITAYKHPFEEFYKIFYNNQYNPSSITANLGREFMGLKVSLKPWPACRGTHTYIKAALELVKAYDLKEEEIDEVIVTVGRFGKEALCTPLEEKQSPVLSINAKISLPYVMGLVFAKGRVVIEDFLSENLGDSKVLGIARRVRYAFDPQLSGGATTPGIVEVRTKHGRSLLKREDVPYGDPRNPMADDEVMAKFRNCARFNRKAMGEEKIDRLAQFILRLEHVKNMSQITEMLP